MRTLVVSAHYPPNFVSGGTLQPQRLARGLRARGHEVSVYAGWLDADRAPLETWTDHDDTGMPIRWVVTTPWIGWQDRRNFDNPSVTADFASHLRHLRPDVVHLHSLQGLGGGLVGAAARSGAAVAVTMHDFWWSCSRQFLVDRAMRPCSIVVDAGSCPCEVDHSWLTARNRWLARAVDHADLVLAPSESAARVLAANGVDPGRLRVDENGLPGSVSERVPAGREVRRSQPVRLLYVGGSNEMKGAHIVVDAARRLGSSPGWAMRAYDLGTWTERTGVALDGLPVELCPPFDPASVEDVFAWADVLVVPSVMRESHSLVTREALVRGVPVVCTDSLGPEEVVDDGVNGLVVPAGDARALAGALRRLIDEPGLLEVLRQGAARPVAVRSLEGQVAGLEKALEEIVAAKRSRPTQGGAGAPGRPGGVRRVVFACGIEGAPLRYRARLPAEALELRGVATEVRHYRHPDLPGLVDRADALVVYRVPATHGVLDLVARARRRGVRVFFDVDDLIFDPAVAAEIPALKILERDEAALWMEGVRRYRTTMEACDAFIGSTAELCRHAAGATGMPAHRFANGVGTVLGRLSDDALRRPRLPGPPRLGYFSGTNTHDHDWLLVEASVAEILSRHPGVELWLVGQVRPSPALGRFGSRVLCKPAVAWTALPALLRQVDVNLAPLEPDSRFNEAKSAIKWVEAALTETATVASPTGPFREHVVDGVNGALAGPDSWVDTLDRLVVDDEHRARLGRRARRDALLDLSPHLQGRRYLSILEGGAVLDGRDPSGRVARRGTWAAVVHDEPPEPVILEPYGPAPVASPARTADGRLESVARRLPPLAAGAAAQVRRSYRDQGASATARRALRASVHRAAGGLRAGRRLVATRAPARRSTSA